MDIKSSDIPVAGKDLQTKNLLKNKNAQDVRKNSELVKGETIAQSQLRDKSYNVNLSPKSKELQEAHNKAFQIAQGTSPIRENKVAALKEKIKNGTYSIDAGQIADGMLREAVKDQLALKSDNE